MHVDSLPPFAIAFVEAASQPAVVLDESGCVLLWNAAAAQLFGQSELTGPPEHRCMLIDDACRPQWQRALSSSDSNPQMLDVRHVNADGSHLVLTLLPSLLVGGTSRSVIALVQPAGGGQFATGASPLEQAVKSMRDYLVMLDGEGRLRFANQAFLEGLGYSLAELQGRAWQHMVAKSSHPALLEQVRRATLDQGRYNAEICFAAKDGHEVWLKLFASRVDAPGTAASLIVLLSDVTRGRAEERLRGEFAASVSHELRTPLASIKGFTSTILNDATMTAETKLEFLQIIEQEADRLSLLIDDLLDYSHLESGHFELQFKVVDFSDVLGRVLSILKPQIENKHIRLLTVMQEESTPLVGDSARLIQILQNIVGNAIKYTPAGGAVDVDLSEDEHELVCVVHDTGIGISAEDIAHVFDKFYRSKEAKLLSVGTGLGLSIAKGLIEQHGGSIGIASEKGRGTTVTIRLPRQKSSPRVLSPQSSIRGH